MQICEQQKNKVMNRIGIDKKKARELAQSLNQLLANYQVYYQNLRGFHWNITGHNFFELHAKFEELYTSAGMTIDEIAERILTLEGRPLHTYSDYLDQTHINEAKNVVHAKDAINIILANLTQLLVLERSILRKAEEANDEGSQSLLSDDIKQQEKIIWMLSAYNQ